MAPGTVRNPVEAAARMAVYKEFAPEDMSEDHSGSYKCGPCLRWESKPYG